VVLDHYKTTENIVEELLDEHSSWGGIKKRDELVEKLVALIDGRKNKIGRIIDDN
jgi:hypothetical protein